MENELKRKNNQLENLRSFENYIRKEEYGETELVPTTKRPISEDEEMKSFRNETESKDILFYLLTISKKFAKWSIYVEERKGPH